MIAKGVRKHTSEGVWEGKKWGVNKLCGSLKNNYEHYLEHITTRH